MKILDMQQCRYAFLFILICAGCFGFAQNIAINSTGSTADASAILDVTATTKGVLIPRMTSAQRLTIISPAESLLVFDVDEQLYYYFSSGTWIPLLTSATGWTVLGNSGTDATINYIGTNDDQALAFRVNNTPSGLITKGREVLIGYHAGIVNNDTMNVAIGSETLFNNTDGSENTVVGYHALRSNVYGCFNTAIGAGTLENSTTSLNTAVGAYALYFATTASQNTSVGTSSMMQTTTGSFNSALGNSALNLNTTGYSNSAIGFSALFYNNTGYSNTALGYKALYKNTGGYANNAIGSNAGAAITTGYGNVAIGNDAFNYATTGHSNVVIGNGAGPGAFNFNTCTFIGNGACVTALAYSNSSVLGYGASVSASNQVRIGNFSVTSIGGYANWSNISDGRFKTNVTENVPGLEFILALRPVTYNLDVAAINAFHHIPDSLIDKNSVMQKSNEIQTGFIAQEVEAAAQQLNYVFSGVDVPQNKESAYGIRYAEFVVPLVKAVQEQQKQIEALQKLTAEQSELIKKLMQSK